MPRDLARIKQLAAMGHVDYRPDKSVEIVADRCDLTLAAARSEIRKVIAELEDRHFVSPGKGKPYPPCDEYIIERPFFDRVACRVESIRWYVKLGINERCTPPLVWVESCHPSVIS